MKEQKTVFLLDTNVLAYDWQSLFKFEEHDIVITYPVIQELDLLKTKGGNVSYNVRSALKFLAKFNGTILQKNPIGENLGNIFVLYLDDNHEFVITYKKTHTMTNMDDEIIMYAQYLKQSKKHAYDKLVLISRDTNMTVKSLALGITAEDYMHDSVKVDTLYKGKFELTVPDETISALYQKKHYIEAKDIPFLSNGHTGMYNYNSCFILRSEENPKKSALACFQKGQRGELITDALVNMDKFSPSKKIRIDTINTEQTMAYHLLMNRDLSIVTLNGIAGTGKTLMALLSAIDQVIVGGHYKRIIAMRPLVSLANKDIGYLPGDEKQKISPFMRPIYDNLDFISARSTEAIRSMIKQAQEEGILTIEAMAHVRGRTYNDAIIIIDETQNLTPMEVKTIITRMGKNSKIILVGDIWQIDSPYLNESSNGLAHVIDKFSKENYFFYGHMTLEKGERSELSAAAAMVLGYSDRQAGEHSSFFFMLTTACISHQQSYYDHIYILYIIVMQSFLKMLGGVVLMMPLSVIAFGITDLSVQNISNVDDFAQGNAVIREYRTAVVSTSPVVMSGPVAQFDNHFAWFQGMQVIQPDAPNFALLYRHNVGYEMTFTVEDPLNLGYTLEVDYANRGQFTIDRQEPIQVNVGGPLMLGRLDDGSGPIHYGGFFLGGGGLVVRGDAADPFASEHFEDSKTFTAPTTYVGTNTFTISMSSFPSPTLMNIFQNYGGGEGIIQFGLPTSAGFVYGNYTGPTGGSLDNLGQFVTVRAIAESPVCQPTAELCDGLDNDCDGLVDEDFEALGGGCEAGLGACAVTGTVICNDTQDGTVCDALPLDPTEELCDEIDNDCDGLVDEDVDTDGDGVSECEGADICLDSQFVAIAYEDLKPNHYADVDQDGVFEYGAGTKKPLILSLEDTNGCSCYDLAVLQDDDAAGWLKNGCSVGIMKKYTK